MFASVSVSRFFSEVKPPNRRLGSLVIDQPGRSGQFL